MKNLFTFSLAALLSVSGLFAQEDSIYVAGWSQSAISWFPKPLGTPVKAQATAVEVELFDAAGCDFDTEWAKIATENVIDNQLGMNASHMGADDFKNAGFKVFADASNMYILLQYTDDDVTGKETVEVAWAPYDSIDARRPIPGTEGAWYIRYVEFGAYKATFKKIGFDAAMVVTGAPSKLEWGGTNPLLAENLLLDNHTVAGSSTVKQIITIGFPALTGDARPEFNLDIWNAISAGKGISFDMKVNDVDTDDALNTENPPVAKPAEYWWNTTTNDCYAITWYAGNLNVERMPASGDDAFVANWQLPIDWFAGATAPAGGIDAYPRKEIMATGTTAFNAKTADFDATWAGISGTGNVIGATADNIIGMAASNTGAEDLKDAAFKVLYDESNMYVLLKWTDEDVTGKESAEVCLSPYFKLDAVDLTAFPTAWYTRWSQFGANKLQFSKTGFDAAMMVNFDVDGKGTINWGGTTPTMADNLFVDDKTAIGSKTVKWIITIGYPVLTGEYRPEFDKAIWQALNSGKGISFDMKINDADADDAFNTDNPPVAKPAEYWWNATNNDCWMSTIFAGFLNASDKYLGIGQSRSDANSIFSLVTPDQIQFKTSANVYIYNTLGQQVMSKKNVHQVELSGLAKGIYIVRANNEARKIVH